MKSEKFWPGGVNQIIRHLFNGKRTIQEAKNYMEKEYIGDGHKAFCHKGWETTSSDITAELTVYNLLKDAIALGCGRDLNFESVLR